MRCDRQGRTCFRLGFAGTLPISVDTGTVFEVGGERCWFESAAWNDFSELPATSALRRREAFLCRRGGVRTEVRISCSILHRVGAAAMIGRTANQTYVLQMHCELDAEKEVEMWHGLGSAIDSLLMPCRCMYGLSRAAS